MIILPVHHHFNLCLLLSLRVLQKSNIIQLTLPNLNVSLAREEFIQRAFFPKDETHFNIMSSDRFKKLLATDASTIEGQEFIAEYYGINNWAQLKEKGEEDGLIQDQADSYFYLLKSVKAKSNNDNIWISFYEGLHCHAALLITFLSAVFNPTKNVFQHKSLTASYFREQQLNHYKEDAKTPHKRLRDLC